MTDGTNEPTPDAVAPAWSAPAPQGLKAKAGEVGMKVYMKSPPKAQNAMLQGYLKAQPVAAKVKPHGKEIAAAVATLLVTRKLRRRRKASRSAQ